MAPGGAQEGPSFPSLPGAGPLRGKEKERVVYYGGGAFLQKRESHMRSEEAQIGKQVRVGDGSGLPPELQGLTGMVSGKWGNPWGRPEDLILEVRLENGRTRLFWNHELEGVAERA